MGTFPTRSAAELYAFVSRFSFDRILRNTLRDTLRNTLTDRQTLRSRKAESFAAISGLALTLFNYFRRENGYT